MRYFITGGAGFIGSSIAKNLVKNKKNRLIIFDNFSSGSKRHLNEIKKEPNIKIITGDLKNKKILLRYSKKSDVIIHTAANPDISKAITNPEIDFWEGTYLTQNILEAARINSIKYFIYLSGSGVYGKPFDNNISFKENYGICKPISTYGASKLGCEAVISSYSYMFSIKSICLRLANVVGPGQTHGVGYDFIRKLKKNPKKLIILGDGNQKKSYIYISDVIDAINKSIKFLKETKIFFDIFNIATNDYITVKEIAKICIKKMGLNKKKIKIFYTGGQGGWKGDVPRIKLNIKKSKKLNWQPTINSRNSIEKSISLLNNYLQ